MSHIQLCFSALIDDKQTQNFQSVPASFATGGQVTQPAGVTVSGSAWLGHNCSNIVADQTARHDELGVPALVSTSVIDDTVAVAHVEEHRNTLPPRDTILQYMEYTELESNSSVSCFRPCFLTFADNQ